MNTTLLEQAAPERLQKQLSFILEMDKLKSIIRRTPLLDRSRRENDAEHSWHLAMMALVLGEYAEEGVNLNRVLRMLLLHDVVEIDAGDTFLYEESSFADSKKEREQRAAERIYGLLPSDLGRELLSLWQEFETRESPDARFASALDRLQPMMHNYFSGGGTWTEYEISLSQVLAKKEFIVDVSKPLWDFAEAMIKDAVEKGYLKP